jgi:putative membrane protein
MPALVAGAFTRRRALNLETRFPDLGNTPGLARGARVPKLCLAVFSIIWVILAINPSYRADWLLENLLTFVAVPLAVLTFRRFRFSDQAYVQATVFLTLHTVGSHYTYSEVPLGDLFRDAYGLSRNHYDRVIHLSFGLLLLKPMAEVVSARAPGLSGVKSLWVGFTANVCASGLYEILEWLVASIADPAAGVAYLGMQGDVWDSQKDMALACGGALIAAAAESWRLRRRANRRRHAYPEPAPGIPPAPGGMLE